MSRRLRIERYKRKAIIALLLACVTTPVIAEGVWLHHENEYVKDGVVELKTEEGGTVSYERNDSDRKINTLRSRDVKVVLSKEVKQNPWSLKWVDNAKR